MSTKSSTPRTDEAMFYQPSDRHADEVVPADFARTLEKELNEMTRLRDWFHNGEAVALAELIETQTRLAATEAALRRLHSTVETARAQFAGYMLSCRPNDKRNDIVLKTLEYALDTINLALPKQLN